jgi:hypothetical protein
MPVKWPPATLRARIYNSGLLARPARNDKGGLDLRPTAKEPNGRSEAHRIPSEKHPTKEYKPIITPTLPPKQPQIPDFRQKHKIFDRATDR